MTRLLFSSVAAVLLLAPVAASAATKAVHRVHTMRHSTHTTSRLGTHPSGGRTQSGDQAVDRLNQQSLDAARAGTTAPTAPAQ